MFANVGFQVLACGARAILANKLKWQTSQQSTNYANSANDGDSNGRSNAYRLSPSINKTDHQTTKSTDTLHSFRAGLIDPSNQWKTVDSFNRSDSSGLKASPLPLSPQSDRHHFADFKTKLKTKNPNVHNSIVTFQDLRAEVLHELQHPNHNAGIKWKRFPGLNKILKGHRNGELTIFTGTTGCGKTTFLSEYSLDLCMQGVPTLWGNFEIKNVRLVKKMLNQFAQRRLENQLENFNQWADRFAQLPLYFLTFHGEQSFDVVLDSMRLAIERHNVRHVIIDNLQFMIGNQCDRRIEPNRYLDGTRRLDRFSFQDVVIGACRQFATDHDCHVTLVVHPRKEPNIEPLTTNSIFGGGKASQEADNVIILQMKWIDQFKFQKYVQITKNRYDGDLGMVPISFSKEVEGFGVRNDKSDCKNIYKT